MAWSIPRHPQSSSNGWDTQLCHPKFRLWEYSVESSHPGSRPLHDIPLSVSMLPSPKPPYRRQAETSIQSSASWTSVKQHHKGGYRFYVPGLYPLHNPLLVAFYDMQVGVAVGLFLHLVISRTPMPTHYTLQTLLLWGRLLRRPALMV